jgi:hypothetical protein
LLPLFAKENDLGVQVMVLRKPLHITADLCQAVKLRLVRHIYLARYRMVLGNGRRKLSAAWTDVVMATDGAKIVGKAERTNVEEFDHAKLNAFRRQHDLRL